MFDGFSRVYCLLHYILILDSVFNGQIRIGGLDTKLVDLFKQNLKITITFWQLFVEFDKVCLTCCCRRPWKRPHKILFKVCDQLHWLWQINRFFYRTNSAKPTINILSVELEVCIFESYETNNHYSSIVHFLQLLNSRLDCWGVQISHESLSRSF